MELESLKTNPLMESEGVWKPIGGGRVLVASFDNPEYHTMLAVESRPYQALSKAGGAPSPKVIEKMTIKVMAHTILKNWEGLTIKGEPVEYSIENAVKILTEYPRFRDAVALIATDISNYQDTADIAGK